MAGQTVIVSVLADTKQFKNAMKDLGDTSGLSKLSTGVKNIGKGLALGTAAIGAATVAWGVSTAKSLANIERIGAATDAVLKSTGGAAGKTRADIDRLAGSIEKMSGIEGEVVTEGQNMLLTFTNIKGQNFDRATQTMTDMAVAMNQGSLEGLDLKATSIQLGKALNDPIKGITALSKVGVSFTEDQKNQIKVMQEAGDIAGAQGVIMDELAKEFGGAAEAAGGTFQGTMAKVRNMFGEISERVLSFLLPAMQAVGKWLLEDGIPAFDKFGQWIETVALPALKDLGAWFQREGLPRLQAFAAWLQANVLPVLKSLGTFITGTLIPGFVEFGQWVVKNRDWLAAIAVGIVAVVAAIKIYNTAMAAWKAIQAAAIVLQAAWNAVMAANPLGIIILAIAGLVAALVYFFTQTETGKKVWASFSAALSDGWNTIVGAFKTGYEAVKNFLGQVWEYIKLVWNYSPYGLIINNWSKIMDFFGSIPGKVRSFFESAWNVIKTIWNYSPYGLIVNNWNSILGFFQSIPGRIIGFFGNAGSWLYGVGQDVVQGIVNGIGSAVGRITAAARNIVNSITGPVKKLLGINSPSRLFKDFGVYTLQGLEQGLSKVAGIKSAMADVSGVVADGFNPSLTLSGSGSTAATAGAAGGSIVYNININGVLDGDDAGRKLTRVLTDYNRKNGVRA